MVSGASMDDTLKDGQIVLVNKIVYRVSDVKRFDIVVVKNEINKDKIIKRVIGLPNEKIAYKNNKLFINDELVKVDYDIKDTEDFEYTTSDNEYFVLGDNRPVSKDSRALGPFDKKEIIGRVRFRLFPFTKFGSIE
jgi:signal peptidase I